jgi:hypothetical protein
MSGTAQKTEIPTREVKMRTTEKIETLRAGKRRYYHPGQQD